MAEATNQKYRLGDDALELLPDLSKALYINGEWRASESAKTFKVENPATGEVLAELASASGADAKAALDAADGAQESWGSSTPNERWRLLTDAYKLLLEHKETIASVMTLEMGKPLSDARGEVEYCANFLRWFAAEALRGLGRQFTLPNGNEGVVSYEPVGPCYLISPWNFPIAMFGRKVGPALAAGCTSILKPSENTPLTALLFVRILEMAGLPMGVVNILPTSDSIAISDHLLPDDRLAKISFTGSTRVGATLLADSAPNILHSSMELGGNAPLLVLKGANMDTAIATAIAAKYRGGGQVCIAANRFIVDESRADEFAERIVAETEALKVGNGMDDGVNIGPMINQKAVASMCKLVDDAVARGATVLTGGKSLDEEGRFMAPTVLDNVPVDADIFSNEIFGPVIAIYRVAGEAEALRLANDTEFGLAAYVVTDDYSAAKRARRKIRAGMIGVNTGAVSDPTSPFGGMKQSGLGTEGGSEGIYEYLDLKVSVFG